MNWRPTATVEGLRARAELLAQVRAFFEERHVLEVETPLLSAYGVTDLHLQNLEVTFRQQKYYLQTSPEYSMKRLLANGMPDIYTLTKAFRDDPLTRIHNPEFTLLEWYRLSYSDQQMMDEIETLVQQTLACPNATRLTYQDVFLTELDVDPLAEDAFEKLTEALLKYPEVADLARREHDLDTLLQLAMSVVIEPRWETCEPIFVYDWPRSQAALAQINPNDHRVAQRFELYYQGVELANGFVELLDADEQHERFLQENRQREELNLQPMELDERLLAALQSGLPACAGVALGVDRLVMLQQGIKTISDVLSFPIDNA